jgi:myo-inositol 2-dehydrogenase/D-chiro-inositol 1-dehydrogenase
MEQDSRRNFFRNSALTAGAFTIIRPELVRGQGKPKLKAGVVGCGGRGTQAVTDMLSGNESIELVAMADVFEDKLEASLKNLRSPRTAARYANMPVERKGEVKSLTAEEMAKEFAERVNVAPDKHFVGFDAFEKLIASDVDIVMLCTPPGYRPQHFEAAVKAGKHVFAEKPVGTDPVGVRRFMAAAKLAEQKKLTVVSGAQRRASRRWTRFTTARSGRSAPARRITCPGRCSTCRRATRSGRTWSGNNATGTASCGFAGTRSWSSISTTSTSSTG